MRRLLWRIVDPTLAFVHIVRRAVFSAQTAAVLRSIDVARPGEATYFGHMKWRGWDVDDRFQACGGTWGNAVKTASDILSGGIAHGIARTHSRHTALIAD